MIKVTLLGDSIRQLGYGSVVPGLLGPEYEVYQPGENCRFALYTLRGLFDWQTRMEGSRIVHWNNGLWDICDLFGDGAFTPEDDYVRTMLRIADILTRRYEAVIFATTTPVTPQNPYNRNELIRRYNEVIVPLLKEKGVMINDLYAAVAADPDKYISADTIHLSPEGVRICSDLTADTIRRAAAGLGIAVESAVPAGTQPGTPV